MFATRARVFFLLFCNFVLKCQGLEKISTEDDHTILLTESIIRNTTNKLFSTINIKGVRLNPKIKQFSIIHNFFTTVTLRDHKSLNTIVRLSRVNKNKINNGTWNFMNMINRILNDDSNDEFEVISDSEDISIVLIVDKFLANLEKFKESDGHKIRDINEAILKILHEKNTDNVTESNAVKENDVLTDTAFWVPDQPTRRIFKGDRTKVKYFPFMASIQVFNTFQCGGSIIKSDLILTAASCLQLAWNNRFYRENPAFLSVRVGSNFYNGGGENIPVLEVYFHPEYDPKNLRNNICLLRLLRQLKFRKNKRRLKMIDIDRSASALPMTTDGITIVGWGARGIDNMISSPGANQLTYAVLDVYHLKECQEIYSSEYVTRTNFCAGFISKGGGACNRDVGGPGVVNGYLVGVVSFGSPVCGTPDAPTVFTKVGFYADWIDDIMDQDVPYIRKSTTSHPEPLPREPLTHKFFESTTFKIPPLGSEKITPPSIYAADSLRIEDPALFNEFLSTMFDSNEVRDYRELINDIAVEKAKDSDELADTKSLLKSAGEVGSAEDMHEYFNRVTKLDFKGVTESNHPKYSVATDEKTVAFDDMENNTVKLIDKINMDDSEDSIIFGADLTKKRKKHRNEKQAVSNNDEIDDNNIKPSKPIAKKKEDEVLTLLYLSEDEKDKKLDDIGNIIEDFDENFSEGLSISLDEFKDLTFRHNETDSIMNLLSKNELYDILNEAVEEANSNKDI